MSKKRAEVEKNNVVLETLEIVYMPVDSIKPNAYNPNRQSAHDFELLCKSIAADGFTQPIIVHKETLEIVDGEHRWRACKALGFEEVPCVMTSMTQEQMRIATLRHNRARGSEDAALAADVVRELLQLGAIDMAKDELMLDEVEMKRLIEDMPEDELKNLSIETTTDMLRPDGSGLSDLDKTKNIDLTADERRAKERILNAAKKQEEKNMATQDGKAYRLMLIYTGDEAALVKEELRRLTGDETDKNLPRALVALCRSELEGVPPEPAE